MDVTRERIRRFLEQREPLLSFQTGFKRVSAAVVCAVLESTSGLEPSSVITAPVLEACGSLKLLSVCFNLCVDATGIVCHRLGLLGTDLMKHTALFINGQNEVMRHRHVKLSLFVTTKWFNLQSVD